MRADPASRDAPSSPAAALTEPRSIAVIGASDDPAKLSGRAIANLERCGHTGRILPVNSHRDTVQERPAYPGIDAPPRVLGDSTGSTRWPGSTRIPSWWGPPATAPWWPTPRSSSVPRGP